MAGETVVKQILRFAYPNFVGAPADFFVHCGRNDVMPFNSWLSHVSKGETCGTRVMLIRDKSNCRSFDFAQRRCGVRAHSV